VAKRKKTPPVAANLAFSASALRLAGNLAQTQLKLAETGTKAAFAMGALNLKAARLLGNALLSRPWVR
jgi:hypothetical protein